MTGRIYEFGPRGAAQTSGPGQTPKYESDRAASRVNAILADLPADVFKVLRYKFAERLKGKEVRAVLGINTDDYYKALQVGYKALIQELKL